MVALVSILGPTLAGADKGGTSANPDNGGPDVPKNVNDLVAKAPPYESSAEERSDSKTTYADTTASEAEALATETFPVVGAVGANPIAPGIEVSEYRGRFTALVETTEDPANPQLLESITPLLSGGEPVDLALEPAGGGLAPANATSAALFPSDLDQGITVGDAGLRVGVEGASGAGPAEVIGESAGVLYPEVAKDTDLLTGVTVSGVELLAQLRSAASPEEVRLSLNLPAGATLEKAPRGGAVVMRDDVTLAAITPPLAMDADLSPVKSKMTVSGSSLVLEVNHQGKDLHYPIAVDPVVQDGAWSWTSGNTGQQFFEPWQSAGTGHVLQKVYNQAPYNGLWIKTYPGNYYFNSHGAFSFRVPHSLAAPGQGALTAQQAAATSAYLTTATYNSWYHYGTIAGQPYDFDSSPILQFCLVNVTSDTCIQDSNSSGAAAVFSPGYYNGGGNLTLTNVFTNTQAERVSVDHPGDSYTPSGIQLVAQRWTQIGGFAATMADGEPPNVSATNSFAGGGALPTGWTNRIDNVNAAVQGNDGGLGVQRLQLWLGCDANRANCISTPAAWNIPPVGSSSGTCLGGRSSTCPQQASRQHTYSLGSIPEGLHYGYVQSTDPLGKPSATTQARWPLMIDRSAPAVQAPAGSLYAERNLIYESGEYDLRLSATDGSTASPAQQRSGVKKIEVFVDGQSKFSVQRDCVAPEGSCAINWQSIPEAIWSVPEDTFTPGTHTVRIEATDMLGHVSGASSQAFTVNVLRDEQEPSVSVTQTTPDAAGNFNLVVSATDVGGSGVGSAEVWMDGEFVTSYEQQCPSGGCSLNHSFPLTSSHSTASHRLAVYTDDKAGNGVVSGLGLRKKPAHVGYNDQFHSIGPGKIDRALQAVDAGGGNLIRTYISWCHIAENIPEGQRDDPTQGNWSAYEEMFQRIDLFRDTHPELRVLVHVLASPPWARGTPATGCGPAAATPPGDDAQNRQRWANFVGEVLRRFGPEQYGLVGVQVWNEPNSVDFWGGQAPEPRRYARLYNAVYQLIRDYDQDPADPNNPPLRVMPAGLTPTPTVEGNNQRDYMRKATDPDAPADSRIAAGSVDAIAVHMYANNKNTRRSTARELARQWDLIKDGLRPNYETKPRWITETGFPSAPRPDRGTPNESTQKNRLLTAWNSYGLKGIVRTFVVHRLFDQVHPGDPGALENRKFGLLNQDIADPFPPVFDPREAYCALADQVPNTPTPAGCP